MSLKDSLVSKLETQTEYWNKQIDKLRADSEERIAKAKDEQAEAEIQKEVSEKIQSLESQMDEARQKANEIRDAGESRLDDLKKRIDEWLPGNGN